MRSIIEKKKSPLAALYAKPPKVKLLSVFVVFLVISLFGFLLLSRHAHTQAFQMMMQKTQLESEITQQSKVYEELRYFAKNSATAQQEYDALLKTFPSQAHLDDVLAEITKIGTQDGVKFISFQPQAEVKHDYYAEAPVDISVVGGFHHLAKFLSDIANLSKTAIVVNQFTLAQTDKQDNTLSLNCVATIYYALFTPTEVTP